MDKPDYPEILNTPMTVGEGPAQLMERVLMLYKHYGAEGNFSDPEAGLTVILGLAQDHIKGFQMRVPGAPGQKPKLGRNPKIETIIRDINLFVYMARGIEETPNTSEEAIAYTVFEQHPSLATSGDNLYRRWKLLKAGKNSAGTRMRKMITRLNRGN